MENGNERKVQEMMFYSLANNWLARINGSLASEKSIFIVYIIVIHKYTNIQFLL